MKRIKVAFFISNLVQGGAERQFVELIKNIDIKTFEVNIYLYAYQKEAFYGEVFSVPGINVHKNKLKKRLYPFKILEALLFIRSKLLHNKYDIVYTTLFMNGFFVRLAAPRFYHNRIICSMRTSIKNYNHWYLLVEKILIRKSFLVFNSKKTLKNFKNLIKNRFHNRLQLIYNGFNIIEKKNITNLENMQKGKIKIGGIGRQNIEKNFSQLVRVFQKLKVEEIYKNSELVLQGSNGTDSENIINLYNIYSNGISIKQQSSDITRFFLKINILVIPSLFEGCPNVLFEAMIHKTICIISKGANSDDFVTDGVNGFVYDGSDEGLLQSLKKAISILGKYEENQIIENAFRYVKENFSMKTMVKNYENLFLEIYEKNKSRH